MTYIKILFILLIVLFLVLYLSKHNEHYAGALIQLYSKGPQDRYLTNNSHIYDYYSYNPVYPLSAYNGYNRPRYFWNEPTRFRRNEAPYLLLTPDRYYLY
jgi:hypothetical protein